MRVSYTLKSASVIAALAVCTTSTAFAQTVKSTAGASNAKATPATSKPAPVAVKPAVKRPSDALAAHFKRDELGNLVPDIRAAAAIAYDPQTGQILWEEHSKDERSIASLTKLMTAVTFIADDPDLSQRVTVTRADLRNASTTYLRIGDVVSTTICCISRCSRPTTRPRASWRARLLAAPTRSSRG